HNPHTQHADTTPLFTLPISYPAFVPFPCKYDNKCGIKETKARTLSRKCLRIWRFWKQTQNHFPENVAQNGVSNYKVGKIFPSL
ncbi:hypothetical protein, partial [Gardnerella vaginalis]|uniref:hypothetical protein n=1 Tax=Gardnerella vaginalis TaxID=2702 RepID=UPI001E467FAC